MTQKFKENLIFTIGMIVIFFIYLGTRWELFSQENLLKMQNADYAVYSLMAQDIISFKSFPFYYYGQNYMGPLTSIFMVIIQVILNLFDFPQPLIFDSSKNYLIGPLTSSLTPFVMIFLGVIFYGLGIKKFHGVSKALITCLILALGTHLLMSMSVRPNGVEMAFLLSGIITWRGVNLIEQNSKLNQFTFGLLAGFSWWMNQTVIFALLPIGFYFLSNTPQFKFFRNQFKIKDRILLNLTSLNYKPISPFLKTFLLLIHFLLTLNLVLGLVVSVLGGLNTVFLGVRLKISNGFSPIKSTILIFLGIQFIFWLVNLDNPKQKLKELLNPIKYFLTGFLIGYGPIILGRTFNLFDKAYGVKFQPIAFKHLHDYWKRLVLDFFPGLLTKGLNISEPLNSLIPSIFFTLLIFSGIIILFRNKKEVLNYICLKPGIYSKSSIFWGVIFFNTLFILLADRARDQYAYRYAVLMLPIIALYCCTLPSLFKSKFSVYSVLLTVCLCASSYFQGKSYKTLHVSDESIENRISYLVNSDCELYLTNYWNTYLYQWHLQGRKEFIVVDGQDRTPKRTESLQKSKLKKCILRENWSISKI